MKILALLTGGTIGSSTHNGITSPDPESVKMLLNTGSQMFEEANSRHDASLPEDVIIDTLTPYYILSEELCAHHLNLLTEAIAGNLHKDYDAILIAHGSDTIRYTASLLDNMFADTPIPIILICSNYPLRDPRTNGPANFAAALALIRAEDTVPGIYVPYRNDPQIEDTPVSIHSGSRLLYHLECSGDMHSIDDQVCAWYRNGKIIKNRNFVPSDPAESDHPSGRVRLKNAAGILPVFCAPGTLYPQPEKSMNAIILMPYHSGTLPVNDPAFIRFCTACRNLDLPVMLPAAGCKTYYSTGNALESLGIHTVPLTAISLYTKLWIAISNKEK